LQGQAQLGAAGAQQLGSAAAPQASPQAAGAQQVGSTEQPPQQLLHFERHSFGMRIFGQRIFGQRSFGIFQQDFLQQPQLSPQVLPQPTGAQQLGSTAAPQASPQAAGAQQEGSTAAPQASPQAAGAQQLASTGAQQVGSTLHPQPWLWWNRPNSPACALLAMENTTRAVERENIFMETLLPSFC
jgi:hypothetical protein